MRSTRIIQLTTLAALGTTLATAEGAPADTSTPMKIFTPGNTGVQGDYAYSVLIDHAGDLWVSAADEVYTEGGLARYDGYRWENYSTVDGDIPTHELYSLTEDLEGNFWAGSEVGLIKFDGLEFRVYDKRNAPLPTNDVVDVAIDSKGNVWFAMYDESVNLGGLGMFDGTDFTIYTVQDGSLPWPGGWAAVSCVAVGPSDEVYIGSPTSGAAKLYNGKWTWYNPNALVNRPPSSWINDIQVQSDGIAWFLSPDSGFAKLSGRRWTYYNSNNTPLETDGMSTLYIESSTSLYFGTYLAGVWHYTGTAWKSLGWPGDHVYSIDKDPQGRLWVAGIDGVGQYASGRWTMFDPWNTGLPVRFIDAVHFDVEGDAWISSGGGGIAEFDGQVWRDFNPYNHGVEPWPFPTDAVKAITHDAAGQLWIGTYGGGVGVWDGSAWTVHLLGAVVRAIAVDSRGDVWAGTDYELYRYDGTRWTSYTQANSGLPADAIQALGADAAGNVWIGTWAGLTRFDGSSWFTFTTSNSGIAANSVYDISVGPDGSIWVGTYGGLSRFNGSSWTSYTTLNSPLPANPIWAVKAAPNGVVWAGAFDIENYPYNGGLARLEGSTWTVYTTENSDLPHEQIASIDIDRDGNAWVGTASEGVVVLLEQPSSWF